MKNILLAFAVVTRSILLVGLVTALIIWLSLKIGD
jgi:hypothetical protein